MQVYINGEPIEVKEGSKISDYLHINSPCGGKGKCGKCKVVAKGSISPITKSEQRFLTKEEIEKDVRLACMTDILGDTEIFTIESQEAQIATDGKKIEYTPNPSFNNYGLAVDIGTTTVVVGLYSSSGKLLGKTGYLNPQSTWGADVISRIEASLSGKNKELQKIILDSIEQSAISLCKANGINELEIDGAVITGNTAMLYMLTQTNVEPLARMPFQLTNSFGKTISAKDIGLNSLNPHMQIYLPPCISPFIGADTVCALLVTSFWKQEKPFMLIDIGTNGEMVLFINNNLYACSTSAGPAFEGAGLSCGMRGEEGAIEHIFVENGQLRVQTINNKTPKGICGSGVIDAIACLLETNRLDETGYMEDDFKIADNVYISRKDIRAVQLAKGAIYAGIATLLNSVGAKDFEIDSLLLAGGFGGHVNLINAGKIRLIPESWVPHTKVLGNAAYSGAEALLLDKSIREKCKEIIKLSKIVDLSQDPVFLKNYTVGMMFE